MQRSGPSRKAGGRGTSLPQFLRGFLKASRTRHFGDTKAHESLLSSWSSAWGGIREAAGGLCSPDVKPRELWVAGPGLPRRSDPPLPPEAGSRALET